MRIAFFFESQPDSVGPFQQTLSTLQALHAELDPAFEIVVLASDRRTVERLQALGIAVSYFRHDGFARLLDRLSGSAFGYAIIQRLRKLGCKQLGRALDAVLDQLHIDMAFFNNIESDVVLRVGDHPFLVWVWDVDKRDHPDFPESFRDRSFERVNRHHAVTLQRAAGVIVNSRAMAERLHWLYQVDQHRLLVAPFRPSFVVREHAAGPGRVTAAAVAQKYSLPAGYLYMPAYQMFHKNTLYVLEALALLQREGRQPPALVLSGGGDEHVLAVLQRQIAALGLQKYLHLLGQVDEWEVPALYEGAFAMVLPSFFGPINLPLYEATLLRCPVLCADWPACREVMADAALYCDLMDPASLAGHLRALLEQVTLREALVARQDAVRSHITAARYGEVFNPYLRRFADLRRRWS